MSGNSHYFILNVEYIMNELNKDFIFTIQLHVHIVINQLVEVKNVREIIIFLRFF